jgi:hypothetical protein
LLGAGLAANQQPTLSVVFDPTMNQVIQVTPTAALVAGTMYTLTVTQSVTDTFDQPAPAPQVYTFTTAN